MPELIYASSTLAHPDMRMHVPLYTHTHITYTDIHAHTHATP